VITAFRPDNDRYKRGVMSAEAQVVSAGISASNTRTESFYIEPPALVYRFNDRALLLQTGLDGAI
jgi:hypothetical protein